MKFTKDSSALSRAWARVLDPGATFFSCGFKLLLESKNTCHLFEFYLILNSLLLKSATSEASPALQLLNTFVSARLPLKKEGTPGAAKQ